MDYSKRGELKISMEGYLKEVLDNFPEEIPGRVEMPAATHLFEFRNGKEQTIMDKPRGQVFNYSVAKLLFTSTRCREDIQTAVALLTTQVRSFDEDDWRKVQRLLQYVKCTIQLPLILSADNLNVLKWWVDASYAAHDDMGGNTTATMSLGFGSLISMSKKQKINTMSST